MLKTVLTAALLLAGTPALAHGAAPGIRVAYADLDLASPAGVAELDRRIARAVNMVCPVAVGPAVREHAAAAKCREATLATVASQRDLVLAAAGRRDALKIASARR